MVGYLAMMGLVLRGSSMAVVLPTIEESVDLDIIAFDRIFRSSFDPEHGSTVPSIFADVVQHQLRLTRSTEPPHD